MPLHIVRQDITRMKVDAIVNAANHTLLGGGGVDGAIHRAAGRQLLEECRLLGGCRTGEAKITGGYDLPCKYVIHTVGPVWHGGGQGERELLTACYLRSLMLAQEHGCRSVAFPLISSGAYGYPKDQAMQVAMGAIASFLRHHDMTVYIVVFDRRSVHATSRYFDQIAAYIDDHYVEAQERFYRRTRETEQLRAEIAQADRMAAASMAPRPQSLEDALKTLDESFSEMLLRKIDERGMKDSDCYKKANIDRKLFHKIRSDKQYKPSKPTVLAFAIALELPLVETREMLRKAGFALSRSNKFDVIVEYFISTGNYDIHEINIALFDFDQSLLGG